MNRRVIRVNPFREMVEMQRALDRFFDDAGTAYTSGVASYTLPVDVIETANAYRVIADLPGLNDEDIAVSIDNDVLSIVAEFPAVEVAEDERSLMNERRVGKFSRHLTMGKTVDADAVEAVYEDGVLVLTLPFVPEVQPKQIAIKTGK